MQDALRLQHDGAVDHPAVELGDAGRCGLGGEHAPGPVEGRFGRRQRGLDRGDLTRMDAQLRAEAASPGAAQLDGRMIDRPVVLQAERTLRRAGV